MRKLNAPGDSVQDVFSTCIESYRDAALKNRLRSIVPVLSDEASRFEDCVLTSKTHTIPTADNVGGVVSKAEMLDIYESKFVKGTGRPYSPRKTTAADAAPRTSAQTPAPRRASPLKP